MSKYFSDSPIETELDDQYGLGPFAHALTKSIVGIRNPKGTTIALNGPWGSGKSSAINLIRNSLPDETKSKLVVTEFKCWWYRGEEALALAFLQNLNTVLRDNLGDQVEELVPALARGLLRGGPVIGQAISLLSGHPWLAGLIGKGSQYAESFFPKDKTVEKTFQKLSAILEGQERRFLVIIDDIDRLNPDEALAVFRMVKSVGRLPNVIYLLAFDRVLADKAVQDRYPSEGPHFLEKIVQAAFELPRPLPADLNRAVLTAVQTICGNPPEDQITRIMNLFYDVVAPLIATPRHVVRYENAITVTWPAVKNEVSIADFLALEAIRLYEPALFRQIRDSKQQFCGVSQQGDPNKSGDARFDGFIHEVPDERKAIARVALQRLFPRLESVGYGSEWLKIWDQGRRICVDRHFDTYFRLSLGEGRISHSQIDELLEKADDKTYVQTALREAAKQVRPNGQSMVPVYLDELTTHASRVPREKVGALMTALFEIHDEIDLERDEDKGFMGMASTELRYHWLIRALTRDRFSLEQRSAIYVKALENASTRWQVDFAISVYRDYHPSKGGPVSLETCLVLEDAVSSLRAKALEKLRHSAEDGTLLQYRKLGRALYEWKDLNENDASEPRAWADAQLTDDASVVIFAKTFTGQSHSHSIGMFGLGDRVSQASTVASLDPKTDIIDFDAFKARLEQLEKEAKLPPGGLDIVRTFLKALKNTKHGFAAFGDDSADADANA